MVDLDDAAATLPPTSAVTPSSSAPEATKAPDNGLIRLLRQYPRFRNIALALCILCIPLGAAILWFAWFKMIPSVWLWGIGWTFRVIPAGFALFVLATFPVWAPVGAIQMTMAVINLYTDAQSARFAEAITRNSSELEKVEDDLKGTDKSGIVLLLRYSRIQLEAYYRIGLNQTQHSFRYSVVSMWIGFAVIMIGIVVRVVDLSRFHLMPQGKDVTQLVIIAGVVIEAVAALFLWVYRQSVKQLTYFYNRQMYDHTVLMCLRISETMGASDAIKTEIVQKVMDKAWALDYDPLPSGASLLNFKAK